MANANGCRTCRQGAGRGAAGFLPKPCHHFEMSPEKKYAHGCPRTRTSQMQTANDNEIIARFPLPARAAIYLAAALTVTGVIPMALAELWTWLADAYGLAAWALLLSASAAAMAWVMRHG